MSMKFAQDFKVDGKSTVMLDKSDWQSEVDGTEVEIYRNNQFLIFQMCTTEAFAGGGDSYALYRRRIDVRSAKSLRRPESFEGMCSA